MAVVVLNNRYRVIRELGQGGFGKTFLAVDTHLPSERPCVIKQLYPIVSKPKQYQWVRERFQREAAILEELSRGNGQIPQLYAYFAEAETFYLVQEYIEGETLTEKVEKNGILSEREVTNILISLLHVLDYVHRHQIIHRDVKPDNVILRASDGKPVLIDFGVVKEALERVMDSDRTHSIAIGTPGYMPSEQAGGRPVYSSDLYSLGLTAVFLLSGKPPHTLESDPRTGELLWRNVVPRLHSQLAGIIDRAVCFHPRDRFADAKEMLAALTASNGTPQRQPTSHNNHSQQNLTQAATAAAVPPSLAKKGRKQNNGNPFFVWFLIVVMIILGSGAVSYGMIQVLQSLRENSDRTSLATEDSNESNASPQEETSSAKEKTDQPKRQDKKAETDNKNNQSESTSSTPSTNNQIEAESDNQADPGTVMVPTISEKPDTTPEKRLEEIPIFSTGVNKEKVIATLGTPSSTRKGYWKNTQTVLYEDYVSGKLDLGYIFDRDTGSLQQTEASFASSVDLNVMESTLKHMLQGEITPTIANALAEVYRKETDLRSFSIQNWEGVVERRKEGTIYIGVWEESLH
ncbi:MAG: serine/threonine protein kinase [Cyanobacteria bacterium SW_9_44_58]|nr:MAG: serine/threonine protein kinase [Cyanobacteria bacterium SW_9_44_58]